MTIQTSITSGQRKPTSTPASAVQRRRQRQTIQQQRQHLEAALERLLAAAEAVIEDLNTLDGDVDLEPSLGFLERHGSVYSAHSGDQRQIAQGFSDEREDEHDGREPEDEGDNQEDREPDDQEMCNWQDEGDQTRLRPLPVHSERPANIRSPHQDVDSLVAVRVLR